MPRSTASCIPLVDPAFSAAKRPAMKIKPDPPSQENFN
ncbi:hypothetical protein RISK_001844 [Rhodopirellula islandica]|uniref:Uncharacterized protein n=1 Tax=Rhodopirellula islandica TaxID=595434 RepID=A0A0J1BHM2_RHOIS|nr:hypothetical protein RISK_001844 [Rhodopirellula islandica]